MAGFIGKDTLIDLGRGAVVRGVIAGIIRMGQGAGGVVKKDHALLLAPFDNGAVVPFVRRDKPAGFFPGYAQGSQNGEVLPQIFQKLIFGHQQGVSPGPVAVKEMFIGMCADVMPPALQLPDDFWIPAAEITGKKEGSRNLFLFQGPAQHARPFGVFMPGKNQIEGRKAGIPSDLGAKGVVHPAFLGAEGEEGKKAANCSQPTHGQSIRVTRDNVTGGLGE